MSVAIHIHLLYVYYLIMQSERPDTEYCLILSEQFGVWSNIFFKKKYKLLQSSDVVLLQAACLARQLFIHKAVKYNEDISVIIRKHTQCTYLCQPWECFHVLENSVLSRDDSLVDLG